MRRGVHILARNVRVDHGELDLVVRIGDRRVAIEVKTIQTGGLDDPVFAFTEDKARRVRTAANLLDIPRIDLVAVTLSRSGIAVRWIPEAG
jgi:Holliday junction resolvase-like predicted endonuclease